MGDHCSLCAYEALCWNFLIRTKLSLNFGKPVGQHSLAELSLLDECLSVLSNAGEGEKRRGREK